MNVFRHPTIAMIPTLLAAASVAVPADATTMKHAAASRRVAGATSAPAATSAPTVAAPRAADSTMTLRGGDEGTVFRTLTVEGEDRIHLELQRPELRLELDPEKAPGLDWGSARDVLDRTTPDLAAPLLAASARERSPYVGHPWLSHFASGVVARFRPAVTDVESWKLSVASARGETVMTFEGKGVPPKEIAWNGLSSTGAPVLPGLTYSYVFEARDRAGNKRNFVGDGFGVSAWRFETANGPALAFSGSELRGAPSARDGRPAAGDAAPPVVVEAASWMNQSARPAQPLRIEATARSAEEADRLGGSVARWMGPMLIGGAARLQVATEIRPDAPEQGAVRVLPAR